MNNPFNKWHLYKTAGLLLLFVLPLFAGRISKNARISKVQFSDALGESSKTLRKAASISEGRPFSRQELPIYSRKIEEYLYDKGWLFARIDSVQVKPDQDSLHVQVKFFGSRGKQTLVGAVHLKSDSLPVQTYQNQSDFVAGRPWSEKQIDETIRRFLKTAAEAGFLFARVNTSEMKIRQKDGHSLADINLHVHENERVYINNVLIRGRRYTQEKVILRDLGLHVGQPYATSIVDDIPVQLMRLGIFKSVKQPVIYRTAPDSIVLEITIEEGSAASFDGVIGYIPKTGKTGKGYFTGLVDISFKNLFGTGRKFAVHWKKPNTLSDEFFLEYTEPWVFNYPLDLSGRLERTVRDTTFIQWNYALHSRLHLLRNLAILWKVQRNIYIPDSSASRDFRLLQNEIVNAQIGVEYDTRDYAPNPHGGIFYSSSYAYGLKHNSGPAYIIREDSLKKNEDLHSILLRLEFYYNLWANQVLAFKLNGRQVKGSRLQLTDYFWFGGSRTLRGYRENQFRGSTAAWVNLEYRFLVGRNARLFLFNDWGFYRYKDKTQSVEKLLPGYGLGVRFDTPLGIMGVDFGLGKGDTFGEAKIHFGLINQF